MSKQILLPLKDSMFQLAKSFVHPSIVNHVATEFFSAIAQLVTKLKIFGRRWLVIENS
jgi:hypothetical protein